MAAPVDDHGGQGVLPRPGRCRARPPAGPRKVARSSQRGAVHADDPRRLQWPGCRRGARPASGTPARCPSGPRARWRCRRGRTRRPRSGAGPRSTARRCAVRRTRAAPGRPPRRPASPTAPRRCSRRPAAAARHPRGAPPGASRGRPGRARRRGVDSESHGPSTAPPVLLLDLGEPRARRSSERDLAAEHQYDSQRCVTSGRGRARRVRRSLRSNRIPRCPAPTPGRASTSVKTARSTRWNTSWAIAVAALQLDRLGRVVVDQQHLDLAAVAGVDGARACSRGTARAGPPAPSGDGPARRTPRGTRSRCPVGTSARSPGARVTSTAVIRSAPASPGWAYDGSGRSRSSRRTATGRPESDTDRDPSPIHREAPSGGARVTPRGRDGWRVLVPDASYRRAHER